jgi:hypothetical protein
MMMLNLFQIDMGSPVTSLDQLYAQACLLHPVMIAKVMHLAGRTRGKLKALPDAYSERSMRTHMHMHMHMHANRSNGADDVRSCASFEGKNTTAAAAAATCGGGGCGANPDKNSVHVPIRPNDSTTGADMHAFQSASAAETHSNPRASTNSAHALVCAHFAPCDGSVPPEYLVPAKVKSAQRCVDKADMVYARDVSKLLDVCRQTLYFDTIDDLHACLKAMREDASLQIVRIKSTMHHRADRDPNFAGFRYVCTNTLTHIQYHAPVGEQEFQLRRFQIHTLKQILNSMLPR